ncbi:NADH-quinone oxidoreductase subunit H [bacterium]|nr:NADH-quinone oxidoreductase subunit H [bacterium]
MIFLILLKAFLITLWVVFIGLLFLGIGRKITARIQKRYGPPFYQQFIDVIKLLAKESIWHHWIMILGAIMALGGLIATALHVPIAGILPYDSNGPIFLVLYLSAIGYLGMAMGVSASGNPNAPLGIGRALTLMLGYEIPFAAVLIIFMGLTKSSYFLQIAQSQAGGILHWNFIRYPLAFIGAEIAVQAMMAEKPFDQMIAPAEIASGPLVEWPGKFLGLGMIQMGVSVFIETAIITNLFLGPSHNILDFTLKQFGIYFIALCINAVMPRFKIENAAIYLWTIPLGLGLLQMLITFVL